MVEGENSFIGGGNNNTINFEIINNCIVGGSGNQIASNYSTIGGGLQNIIDVNYGTIGGGQSNTSSGTYSTIAGGISNSTSGSYPFIGGGNNNTISWNGKDKTGATGPVSLLGQYCITNANGSGVNNGLDPSGNSIIFAVGYGSGTGADRANALTLSVNLEGDVLLWVGNVLVSGPNDPMVQDPV